MKVVLLIAAFGLCGCAAISGNTMSAEQLAAASKDKNASNYCVQVPTPWGLAFTMYTNTDKSTIVSGSTSIECGAMKATFTDQGKAARTP